MAWKLLQLKPLKPFFFGKSNVFSNTYYAASEYYPQQSQMMGALRLYWMEQTKLMRRSKDGKYVPYELVPQAQKLVGKTGAIDYLEKDDLGLIQLLSPVFILHSKEGCLLDALFDIPQDIVKKDSKYAIARPKRLSEVDSSSTALLLEDYDVKEGTVQGLGGMEFWEEYISNRAPQKLTPYDKVFISYEQVGISLETGSKQVQEGKFYTKRSYMLEDEYSFGCMVKIDEEGLKEEEMLKDGIMTLGADGSVFKCKVTEVPELLHRHQITQSIMDTSEKRGKKIVLLSDSQLDCSIAHDAYFQIVPYKVSFRMMQSDRDKNNKKYADKHPSDKKSSEKLLTPKGSVYYFNADTTLPKAEKAYRKMGFNHYLILN